MTLTFDNLRAKNFSRCEVAFHPIDTWSLTDWATAMMGEGGEACNLIKKLRREEDISKEDIADEIADMVIYADLLCSRMRVSLEAAVIRKFNVVSDRRECSIKLKELELDD